MEYVFGAVQRGGVTREILKVAGAHDAYNTGGRVSHQDKLWRSTIDGNEWEPGVYGWDEVV